MKAGARNRTGVAMTKCIKMEEERITEGHYAYETTYKLVNLETGEAEVLCSYITNMHELGSAIGWSYEYTRKREEEESENEKECKKLIESLPYPFCSDDEDV